MSSNPADWAIKKISESHDFSVTNRLSENLIVITAKNGISVNVAVLGVRDIILKSHADLVLSNTSDPEFVLNVSSKAIWSGEAIKKIHDFPASFGTLGDMYRAAREVDVASYRNKDWGYYERAIRQHNNVVSVERKYDAVFIAHRRRGPPLTIALIKSYLLSAEDIRNARAVYGEFDIATKMSSYGNVSYEATKAATSMGSKAATFRELMQLLGQ